MYIQPRNVDETSGAAATGGMDGFVQSAHFLRAAATEGQFAANPESGRALVDVMRKQQQWAEGQRRNIFYLAQEPPLGSSPSAQAYKPFFASLVTDPDEGIGSQWEKYIEVLQQTADAIEESMKNYREIDTGQADRLNNISGQIYEV